MLMALLCIDMLGVPQCEAIDIFGIPNSKAIDIFGVPNSEAIDAKYDPSLAPTFELQKQGVSKVG